MATGSSKDASSGSGSASSVSSAPGAGTSSVAVNELTDQLRLLETERDEAVKTGEWL